MSNGRHQLILLNSLSIDSNCNMHRQTSRPVVETLIQTSCNFKANLRDSYYHLDCFHCLYSNCVAILEYDHFMVLNYSHSTVSSNLDSSYTKVFLTLRHHKNQVQDHVQQPNQTNQLSIARYRRAVTSAIWLQMTLVAWCSDCFVGYLHLFNTPGPRDHGLLA